MGLFFIQSLNKVINFYCPKLTLSSNKRFAKQEFVVFGFYFYDSQLLQETRLVTSSLETLWLRW